MAVQIDKAIFLHIPKTGGTWVTNYFKETSMDHCVKELSDIAHINGDKIKELRPNTEDLIFCFVRHPLTWYRSFWQHRRIVSERKHPILDPIVDLSFSDFIDTIIQDHPGYLSKFFRGFTIRCRFVGKQESLREDLDNVLNYLRIPYNRPYLFKRVLDNVIPSEEKYSFSQAVSIMDSEKYTVDTYGYDYLPIEIIES